ncbi:SOSS complex subunit C isoform X2 [Alexandromys fortis]|uniref:SOSS complex subunit C isoform X2 n=1 Tax=Alexandromys fortis TaxID=100897 RepID=UPI002152E425|nr:SOSS complex subunit C isoform X2 [Microtus fortis]
MAANPSGQGFQNKNRVAILAELDKEKRKLLMQNQSSASHPGAREYTGPVRWLSGTGGSYLEHASPSPDPLLTRTSGTMLSSSTLQPSRRQLCSMLTHIRLDTS